MTKSDIIDIIDITIDNEINDLTEFNNATSFNENANLQISINKLQKIKNDLRYYIINEIKIERKYGYT